MPPSRKQQVVDLLKSLETKDPVPFAYVNPNKYIQHNLQVGPGPAGVAALIQNMPPDASVNTIRVFEDGDYVFAHTEYNFFGPRIGFDIFRFEDGLIVEHWDNLQETATEPSPSGHTMIDGPTEVSDLDQTGPIRRSCSATWTTFSQAVARPFRATSTEPIHSAQSLGRRYNPGSDCGSTGSCRQRGRRSSTSACIWSLAKVISSCRCRGYVWWRTHRHLRSIPH
jgi:predicted SnoaL-like aldol condensation-catalyzing enzyme